MNNETEFEKSNRMFSLFCYAILIALSVGTIFGGVITYFILR